jgi:hypothetical protein
MERMLGVHHVLYQLHLMVLLSAGRLQSFAAVSTA